MAKDNITTFEGHIAISISVNTLISIVMSAFAIMPNSASAQYFDAPELTNLNNLIWSPTVRSDGLEIFFTDWSNGNWEVYTAHRDDVDDQWGSAYPIDDINSGSREDGFAISQDGLTLIFGSERSGGKGSWDLWQTTRPDIEGDWSEPQNLQSINTSGGESTPSLSADGLTLYFSSGCCNETRAGSISGSTDIWMATRADVDSDWSTPTNLESVNTSQMEAYPSVSPDGLSLYFMSTRPGFGSEDIHVARRETVDDDFSTPLNLGPTINSNHADFSPSIGADGKLYYTHNVVRGEAPWQIWVSDPIDPDELIPGDLNRDDVLGIDDLNILHENVRRRRHVIGNDLNEDDRTDGSDIRFWATELRRTWIGDANLDGEFNSSDLVRVFEAGEFEDSKRRNSTWSEGDWNGDLDFTSGDFVAAFQDGGYEKGPRVAAATVPEPDVIAAMAVFMSYFLRRRPLVCTRT